MRKLLLPFIALTCISSASFSQNWDKHYQSSHNYTSSKYSNNLVLKGSQELLRVNNTENGFWITKVGLTGGNSLLSREFFHQSGLVEVNSLESVSQNGTIIAVGTERNFGYGQLTEPMIFATNAQGTTVNATRIHSNFSDYGELLDVSGRTGTNHAIGFSGTSPVSIYFDDLLNIYDFKEYSLPNYRFEQMVPSQLDPNWTVLFGVNDQGGLATIEVDEATRQTVGPVWDINFTGLLTGINSITRYGDGFLVACSYTPPSDGGQGILLMYLTADRYPLWAKHYDFGNASNNDPHQATSVQVMVGNGSGAGPIQIAINMQDGDPTTTSNNSAMPALMNLNSSGGLISVHAYEHHSSQGLNRRDAHAAILDPRSQMVYIESETGAMNPGSYLIQQQLGNNTHLCPGFSYTPIVNQLGYTVTQQPVTASNVGYTTSPVHMGNALLIGNIYDCNGWFNGQYRLETTQEEEELTSLVIAPNPSSGIVNLQFPAPTSGELILMDIYGQLIQREQLNDVLNSTIRLEELPAGTYLLQTIVNGKSETHRLVKID